MTMDGPNRNQRFRTAETRGVSKSTWVTLVLAVGVIVSAVMYSNSTSSIVPNTTSPVSTTGTAPSVPIPTPVPNSR